MTDSRLQQLERAWKASGSTEDEAAYLRERVRVGEPDQLAWLACRDYAVLMGELIEEDTALVLSQALSRAQPLSREVTIALATGRWGEVAFLLVYERFKTCKPTCATTKEAWRESYRWLADAIRSVYPLAPAGFADRFYAKGSKRCVFPAKVRELS